MSSNALLQVAAENRNGRRCFSLFFPQEMSFLRIFKYAVYLVVYLVVAMCVPLLLQCYPSACVFEDPPTCYGADAQEQNLVGTCVRRTFLNTSETNRLKTQRLAVGWQLPDTRILFNGEQLAFLLVNALYMSAATTSTVGYGL